MKRSAYFWSIVTLFIIAGCEKEDFPEKPIVEDPTFFADGLINGISFDFTAGERDYYMYTWHEKDDNDIYVFSGEFKKTNGSGEKLTFKIKNSSETSVDIEEALSIENHAYAGPISPVVENAYDVHFFSESQGASPHASYSWAFGDGTFSSQQNPIHRFNTETQSQFDVTLSIAYGDNCSSSATNVVDFNTSCGNSFSYTTLTPSPRIIAFTPVTWGTPPYSYEWDFGNGQTSTDTNPAIYFPYNEVYPVTLKVTDGNNCVSSYQRNVRVETNCVANYSYTTSPVITIDSLQLSHVEIVYTNESGVVYSSKEKTQPSNMSFFLSEVHDFENNQAGEKVKKIDAFYDARLFNVNDPDDYIDIRKARASFGIAYPQ